MAISELNNKHVRKIIFKVFPPYGENDIGNVDIRLGIEVDELPNVLFSFYMDKDDQWCQYILREKSPVINWFSKDFYDRMNGWFSCTYDNLVELEVFDMSCDPIFKNIINRKINMIESLSVNKCDLPFAYKLTFADDFLLSISANDGSSVLSKKFNKKSLILSSYENVFGEILYKTIV